MEQITLSFDPRGYDTFGSCNDFFAYAVAGLKDNRGRSVKQSAVAAEMDLAPSQLSHKLHQRNDTCITLNNAEAYTEAFGDYEWIHYLVFKHIIQKRQNKDELLRLRQQIDEQLAEVS